MLAAVIDVRKRLIKAVFLFNEASREVLVSKTSVRFQLKSDMLRGVVSMACTFIAGPCSGI